MVNAPVGIRFGIAAMPWRAESAEEDEDDVELVRLPSVHGCSHSA